MSPLSTTSPLKAIVNIRREELPLTVAMFAYFFLVITTFWILKPIKKLYFFEYYDQRALVLLGVELGAAQAELIAKVLNMAVAYGAVVVFSLLARRLRRHRLTLCFSAGFGSAFVLYSLLLEQQTGVLAWTFYLFGDLYSSVMVATFFAFLSDSVEPQTARRIYGPIVLGGVAGGAFGTTVVAGWIEVLSYGQWLLVCLGAGAVIAATALYAGRRVERSRGVTSRPPNSAAPAEERHPAWAGAKLVFRSKYLLSIAAIVACYEIASTILDFQFSATGQYFAEQGLIDRNTYFTRTYAITNWVALLVQLFGTSVLLSRFRLSVPLMVLPLSALAASGVFLVFPAVWSGAALNTADNGLNYSVNQSAREALYTAASADEKYEGKAFIDVFVQRFAKALAVGVSLAITITFEDFTTIRYLGLVTAVIVAFWALMARRAGDGFERRTRGEPPGAPQSVARGAAG